MGKEEAKQTWQNAMKFSADPSKRFIIIYWAGYYFLAFWLLLFAFFVWRAIVTGKELYYFLAGLNLFLFVIRIRSQLRWRRMKKDMDIKTADVLYDESYKEKPKEEKPSE